MSTSAQDAYLRNAVMTATPEQLQLMLYDGAIRFTRQGLDALEAKDFEGSFNALSRAQKIILELQSGLRREVNPKLCDQMAQLYQFIYNQLVDASINHRTEPLVESIKLLDYQRETWVLLIEKLNTERSSPPALPEHHPGDGGRSGAVLSVEG